MTSETAPPIMIVVLAVLLAAAICLLRWRAWRRGRPTPPIRLWALLDIPRRYLINVHGVVVRKPAVARMHIQAAGGLLLSGSCAVLALFGGLWGFIGATAVGLSSTVGLIGALLAFLRRVPHRPAHLSGGFYWALPALLAVANLFFLAVGAGAALGALPAWNSVTGVLVLVGGFVSLLGLGVAAGKGPMRHATAGLLHLAWHPRPERFQGEPSTALRTLDLDAPKLGADRVEDLDWNQLLGFDSCVQCGRCEEACPAFAAGLPLNPKKLVNDIAGASASVSYAGSPHPGLPLVVGAGGPILIGEGGAIRPETVWACTTCRACVVSCPMMIEHLDGIFELRRFETLERGTTPGKAPEVLRHLAETDTQCGRSTAERLDFAADLSLPLLEEGKSTEVLLWIGEGGYELRNQRSLRAFIELLRVADVDFAVLPEELDCGDLARRLGDEIEFDRLARANIRALSRLTFRTIVTMDPHIAHSFVRDYPALGGLYEVMHHSRFLVTLISQGRLSLARRMEGRLTYHDPCYLGRYLDEVEAPRRLLDHVTDERLEMTRHGRSSFCCGGGGGAAVTDIRGGRRIPDVRMDQARETGAEMVVVACPTCTIMLEGVSHPRPHVRELSEVLLDALGPAVL